MQSACTHLYQIDELFLNCAISSPEGATNSYNKEKTKTTVCHVEQLQKTRKSSKNNVTFERLNPQ